MASSKFSDILLTPMPPLPDSAIFDAHANLNRLEVLAHVHKASVRAAVVQNLQIFGCADGLSCSPAPTSGVVPPSLAKALSPSTASLAADSSSPAIRTALMPTSPLTPRKASVPVNLLSTFCADATTAEFKDASEEASEEAAEPTHAVPSPDLPLTQQYHDAKCRTLSNQIIRDICSMQAWFPDSTAAAADKYNSGSPTPTPSLIAHLPLSDQVGVHGSLVSSLTAVFVLRILILAGDPPPHVRDIFESIPSLDLYMSRTIANSPITPGIQVADALTSNAFLAHVALSLLLDNHSYNRDPNAELAAASDAFSIRIDGSRLHFSGLKRVQLLLTRSRAHTSLDLRPAYNKIVRQIQLTSNFSFIYDAFDWPRTASSVISEHIRHGQQPITFTQLFDLLDLLRSYEALFSSIASVYADHSAIHTAAFIPTPPPSLRLRLRSPPTWPPSCPKSIRDPDDHCERLRLLLS